MQNLVNRIALPEAHIGKNAFDNSFRSIFSTKVGIAQPVVAIDTVPDGSYRIDVGNLLRTSEIQTAAFARMKQNLDFYYVPYSQLYRRFDDILFDKEDNHRSPDNPFVSVANEKNVPVFDFTELVICLFIEWLNVVASEAPVRQASSQSSSFIELSTVSTINGLTYKVYVLPSSVTPPVLVDMFGDYCVEDVLRLLDMLGFGNWLPFFKNVLSHYIRTHGTIEETPSTYINLPEIIGFGSSTSSIADWLYSPNADIQAPAIEASFVKTLFDAGWKDDSNQGLIAHRFVNLFRVCAYQKIWCDYYRNATYDTVPSDGLLNDYSGTYNLDWIKDSLTDFDGRSMDELIMTYFMPRYRQWKKDLFTGLFPDAQFGDVAVANINSDASVYMAASNVFYGSGYQLKVSGGTVNPPVVATQQSPSSGPYPVFSDTSSVGISAIAIRYAEALQRYREMIIRAGNKHKDLQMAEYGVVSKYELDDYSVFLGSMDARIDINTVTATAQTEDVDLGQLGANGVSSLSGKQINFHTKEFGVIIGIFSILPEAEYENFGMDKLNLRAGQFDWYHNKFANLGFAPVYRYEFNMMSPSASMALDSFDETLGFTARDHEYKTSYDKIHGEFYGSSPVESGTTDMIGAFCDYVTPRTTYDLSGNYLRALYVDPHSCDSIFYSSQTWQQLSDHFKVNMYFQIHSVLPMPVSGLPNNG